MFERISKGGVGLVGIIAWAIILLGQWLGIPFTDANAAIVAQQIMGVAGFVMMVIGQLTRKDLDMGFYRKANSNSGV